MRQRMGLVEHRYVPLGAVTTAEQMLGIDPVVLAGAVEKAAVGLRP